MNSRILQGPGQRAILAVLLAVGVACAPPLPPDTPAPRADCRAEQPTEAAAPIGWLLAPDSTDWPHSDAWCASVGPPVKLAADDDGVPVLDSLYVVTWNVHVGGADVPGFVAALRAGTLTGGRPVEHFVLLLQEAYRSGDEVPVPPPGARGARRIATEPPFGVRRAIEDIAAQLGLSLFYVPSMRNGMAVHDPPEDRGNAILSTLALHDPLAIELPFEAQRRVAVAATVRFRDPGGELRALRVVSAHLDLRSRVARALASLGPARARQADAAARAVDSYGSSVFGGDLNTWAPWGLEEAPALLQEYYPDTPSSDGRATFVTAGLMARRLDHLFFRLQNGFASQPARLEGRFGSDHFPVAAWISYASDGGAVAASR